MYRTFLFSLAILLHLPTTVASVGVTQGAAEVVIENQHAECFPETPIGCVGTIEGSSPGNATIHLEQNINEVRVSMGGSSGGENSPLVIHGDDLYVRYSALSTLTDLANEAGTPDIDGLLATELNAQGVWLNVTGPSTWNPTGETFTYPLGYRYAERGRGIGYDQLGPFNAAVSMSSDPQYRGLSNLTCAAGHDDPACYELVDGVTLEIQEATPNIMWGLKWETINVSALGNSSEPMSRPAFSSPLVRGSQPAPNLSFARRPNLGNPVDEAVPSPPDLLGSPRPVTGPEPNRPSASGASLEPASARTNAIYLVAIIAGGAILAAISSAFYSRLQSTEEAIRHPVRKAILNAIHASPGIGLAQLMAATGITRSAVIYHVRLLERLRLVRVTGQGRRWRVVPAGMGTDAHTQVPVTASERVLAFLHLHPTGVRRDHLGAMLGLPVRTRNHVLRALQGAGSIRVFSGDEGTVLVQLASAGQVSIASSSPRQASTVSFH